MTAGEQIITLDVDSQEAVENVKALLEVESNVPIQQQQLLYNGNEMRNSDKLSALGVKDYGLLMMLSIANEVVLEAVGKSDVTKPLKKKKLNHDGTVHVNGFQVLPSQAESVKRIFEKHPDMAIEFRAKNQHLRTSCINVLLNLIYTLCQSLQNLPFDDLSQAEKALAYLKNSGYKVDWLELKLEQVKKTKIEWEIGKSLVLELEEELNVFKHKCSDIEALLEKEKAKLLGAHQNSSSNVG